MSKNQILIIKTRANIQNMESQLAIVKDKKMQSALRAQIGAATNSLKTLQLRTA